MYDGDDGSMARGSACIDAHIHISQQNQPWQKEKSLSLSDSEKPTETVLLFTQLNRNREEESLGTIFAIIERSLRFFWFNRSLISATPTSINETEPGEKRGLYTFRKNKLNILFLELYTLILWIYMHENTHISCHAFSKMSFFLSLPLLHLQPFSLSLLYNFVVTEKYKRFSSISHLNILLGPLSSSAATISICNFILLCGWWWWWSC